MGGGQDARIILIREYVHSMRERIAVLRKRSDVEQETALATAYQEIETAHEELTVADEELRAQAEALEAQRAITADELRHYRRLFDDAPDGYAVTDAHGTVLEANRTIAAALHVHPRFLERKPLVSFVVRSDCRAFRAALRQLESGEAVASLLISLRPRDTQPPFVADIRAVPVRSAGPRTSHVRWAIRMPEPPGAPAPKEKASHGADTAVLHSNAKLEGAIARVSFVARRKGKRLVVARPDDLNLDPASAVAVGAIVESLVTNELARERPDHELGELHVVIDREDKGAVIRVADARVLLPIG